MARSLRIPVIHDPRAVTTVRPNTEVDPRQVELAADAPDAIWHAVERLYQTGVNPAIALCIRRHGEVVLDRAIGHARGNAPGDTPDTPTELATPSTPFCIFSASKAITAMIIHHLDDRGLLHVGDRVAEYLPGFARHGKQWITIQHVLTHRAGIPSIGDESMLHMLHDPDAMLELLCDARPESAPGRRLAYHAISGGFVLGAVVQAVTGRDIRTYLRDEILDPLGFDGMSYGWHADRLGEVASNAFTGRVPRFPIDRIAHKAIGVAFERAAEVGNTPEWLTSIVPSGNIVATANEASRFFQILLNEGELDGHRVFDGRTIRRATTETSYLEMDFTIGLPVRYGVGLMLGAERLGIFGPRTARAYGHLGLTNIFCWADPARQLSVALLTSGKPLFSRHLVPLVGLLRTISNTATEVHPR